MNLSKKVLLLTVICEFSMAHAEVFLPSEEPAVRPGLQSGFSAASIPSVQRHTLRVAYVIPNNRTAQADAVYKLQTTVLAYQSWFCEQMERNGFGPKTFY